MKLSYAGIQDRAPWERAGIRLPGFDWAAMRDETLEHPTWVHFGAGNIFRGFIARLQHRLPGQGGHPRIRRGVKNEDKVHVIRSIEIA